MNYNPITLIGFVVAAFASFAFGSTEAKAQNACSMSLPQQQYQACINSGATYNGGPSSDVVFGGQPQGGGTIVYQGGQHQRDGRVYQPVQRQEVYIEQSGCSRNLGNALACIGAQTLGQVFVNRSAVREQRDATIAVESARFTLAGGTPAAGPVSTGPQIVSCTLTMPDGRSQTLRMSLADCQAEAQRLGTTAQRRQ